MRRIFLSWVTTLTIAIVSASAANAQMIGDTKAGEALARAVCAECHFVAEDQTTTPRADAPPFQNIVADPAVTELSLRVFLQTPHRSMPNLQLSSKETDDVIRFLLSLRAESGR